MSSFTPPTGLLITAGSFGAELSASTVAAALARGVRAAGCPSPDVCLLDDGSGEDPRSALDALAFDTRMRAARAVVIADASLREQTLAGSVAFEIATRARQGGVPSYAVTAENRLDAFDARILDLQLVIEARTERALRTAGMRVARLSAGSPGTKT